MIRRRPPGGRPGRAGLPQLVMLPGEDVVGVGGDLSPETLLAAYRIGVFPMGIGPGGRPPMGWWCPERRGVLEPADMRISRSLRKSAAHFEVTCDQAFEQVIGRCADSGRTGGWITADIVAAYSGLYHLGHAHSIEVWRGGELAGGLYGVLIGGLFAGESMFHSVRDASKVALAELAAIMAGDGRPGRIIDTQWLTDHLASLGATELDRSAYLRRLARAVDLPEPEGFARLRRRAPSCLTRERQDGYGD